MTTGLVDTDPIPMLLRLLASRQLDTTKLVTRRCGLDGLSAAYEVAANAADTGALKVVASR